VCQQSYTTRDWLCQQHSKFKTYLSRQREVHQSRGLQRLIRAILYLDVIFMKMTVAARGRSWSAYEKSRK
jgi:hypothetical protein